METRNKRKQPLILWESELRRDSTYLCGAKLPSSSSPALSKRKGKVKLPLQKDGREQRGAMEISTEEKEGHTGDGGAPTSPTQPGETGGPIPTYLTT